MKINTYKGFTVIELIVALAIMGLVVTLALPNFQTWQANSNVKAAATDLFSHFQNAKLTAIKSKNLCSIVFNQAINGVTYSYVVFDDPATEFEYNSGESIIAAVSLSDYKGVLFDTAEGGGDGIGFPDNDSGKPAVAFRSNGLPQTKTGDFGSVFLKSNKTDKKLKVVIYQSGIIRIENY